MSTLADETSTPKARSGTEPAERALSGGSSLVRRVVKEPLVQFLFAGGLLFAVYWAVSPQDFAPPADPSRVEMTDDDMRQIALVWLAQGRSIPDPKRMRELAKQEAVQRILVREAMALGLDQDDEIIERRLAQKMDFLLVDLAELDEPSEAELRAWYAKDTERFAMPPRVSFRHLYFSQDERGLDGARADAEALLPSLARTAVDDPGPSARADRFMFRDYYGGRSPAEIAKEFGPAFADELFKLTPGRWQGPIRSGYGWHLVWIDTLEPARAADFDTIADAVRSAWLDERYREIRDRAYDEMLSRYTIAISDPATIDFTTLRVPSGDASPSTEPLQ